MSYVRCPGTSPAEALAKIQIDLKTLRTEFVPSILYDICRKDMHHDTDTIPGLQEWE